ncbi:glycoside hydrolase family 172 protein [Sunxiuqinia sp. sy24]|uniref:glycoside hydrolase family 172 protein n=1 Tax=Sunxiuqinia sp. sy24 TaxID=3461495 RepID=UPI0040466479
MKKIFFFIIVLVAFISCKKNNEINLSSLLNEMVDREQITRFPENSYQCLQASSYNRESVSPDKPGWFADSDGIGYIRTEENNGQKEWVIMEDEGPGVIAKIWAVCFYYGLNDTTGANIKFYLDGNPEPVINTNFFKLVKGQDFVKAPFADESTRAGNLYFPIPYAKSCKITMDNKSFYNIINYRKYPEGTPVKTFTMQEFEEVKELRSQVASKLITPEIKEGKTFSVSKNIKKGKSLEVELPEGNRAVRQLEIKIDEAVNLAQALRSTVLVGEFDGKTTIWCPLGDFFNNVGKIQPYSMWERSVKNDGKMICRWVMPYKNSGKIILKNLWNEPVSVSLKMTEDKYDWTPNSMHFYASWRMDPPTPTFPLFDWNFLEAKGRGVVVGDQWTVLNPREGWWGEGDEKIYVDDDFDRNFPSHFGTGTEDYYGWAGGKVPTPADEFSKPFLGNIIVANPRSMGYNVCSRTRSLDVIPFKNRIRFDVESSCGTRQRWHFLQYSQTTFWYGTSGVKYNRQPQPEMAALELPTLEGLQQKVEEAKNQQYIVGGALEAEILKLSNRSETVIENHANIPVWGEMSSGAMKELWFEKPGDFTEIKLTEQFEKSDLKFCAAVGRICGNFDIYVNGKLKTSQDLFSNHQGMTNPYVDLGENEPENNAFTIRFVLKEANPHSSKVNGKYALGIDFFLVENDFLNR